MKKVFATLISSVAVMSCATTGNYNSAWIVPDDYNRIYEAIGSKDFSVEDKNLKVTYKPDTTDSGMSVEFLNKSKSVLKIIWDESAFIKGDSSEKIFHNGVKIADRSSSLPPSVVGPELKHVDSTSPVSAVEWVSGAVTQYYSSAGGWKYSPICGDRQDLSSKISDDQCVGNTYGLIITYEKDGKRQSLTSRFKFKEKVKKTENR